MSQSPSNPTADRPSSRQRPPCPSTWLESPVVDDHRPLKGRATDPVGSEVGAVAALEDELAVFGEQPDQGGDGGLCVGKAAGQGRQHGAGCKIADAEEVAKLAIDGDRRLGAVDGPE